MKVKMTESGHEITQNGEVGSVVSNHVTSVSEVEHKIKKEGEGGEKKHKSSHSDKHKSSHGDKHRSSSSGEKDRFI